MSPLARPATSRDDFRPRSIRFPTGAPDGVARDSRLRRARRKVLQRIRSALRRIRRTDSGMSTVEYAIGTLAAAAFAAVLYTVVSGDSVVTALTGLVQRALSITF
ncbi:DUF4244 domain-containing protein [Pseudonocardia ailaonensis]